MNGCIGKEAGDQMTIYASLCAHCPWMKKCREYVSMLKIVTKSGWDRDVADSHRKYAIQCFWKIPHHPHGIRICIKRKKIHYGKFFDFLVRKMCLQLDSKRSKSAH